MQEFQPGQKWSQLFARLWPGYRAWFLKEGEAARPTYSTCARALRHYMPELLPTWEALIDLAGGGDLVARFLSLYRPTPYLTGCSQAVWTRDEPLLVRNYDYSPALWEGLLLHTAWNGRQVMAMSDCLWGVLDGMNEAGLSVSLSFGGSKRIGDGFGITLVLRYVLEFCETTAQAAEVLQRIPSHMAYNITLVDAQGEFLTVFVAPDQPAQLLHRPYATNHQHQPDWSQYIVGVASLDREWLLSRHLADPAEESQQFVNRFLQPPLFFTRHAQGWGTLYTSVYKPVCRTAEYRWAGVALEQSFDAFIETTLPLIYPTG